MANVTITSSNPSITVNQSNSVVNVSSTSSTVTVSQVAALANVESVRSVLSVTDTGGDGSLSYNSSTGVFTYTGPSAAEVRAHLSGTAPITYNSSTGAIGIDSNAIFTGKTTDDLAQGSTNKYFTTSGANVNTDALPQGTTNKYFTTTGATVNTDALPEGSTNLYLNGAGTTDDLTQGSTNLYFTNTNANTWFTTQNTGNLAEGGSNLYFTTSRARGVLSASDLGGFGSFSYNNSTGVMQYVGPNASDVRGSLSATSPLTYNSGTGTFGIGDITGLNSSTDVNIKAGDSIYNFIDKNDNSTSEVFKIFANGETTGASDQLFQVDEQGNVTLWGNNADGNQARLRLRKDGDIILTQGNFGASTHLQLNAKLAPTPAGMVSGGTPRNGMWMRVASGTDPDSYTTKANSFIDFNQAPYSSSITGGNWDGMILGHDGGVTVAADWKGANSETAGFTVRRVRGGNISATSGSAENLFRVRANGVVDFGQESGGQTPRARIDMTTSKSNLTIDQAEINDKFTLSNTGISGQAFGVFEALQFRTSPAGEFFPNPGTNGLAVGNNSISTANINSKSTIQMYGGFVDGAYRSKEITIKADGNVNIGIDSLNDGTGDSFNIYRAGSGGSIDESGRVFSVSEGGSVEINKAFTLPNTDGSVDQVLTTNGSGVVTWEDPGSGLTNAQVVSHISTVPLTVGGNLNVQGNIIATGNIDYENVTDLYVTDQKITLNANAATNSNVQIIANRPQNTSTEIKWNEDTDKWTFTNDGSTYYNIPASTSDLAEGTNLYYTDARVDAHLSGGTGITYTAGSIDLDDTAVTPKTYGDATNVPQFTVDQQGRITGVSNVAISGGGGYGDANVEALLSGGTITGNITTTGNVTASNLYVNGPQFSAGNITLQDWPESPYEIKGDLDGAVRFTVQAGEDLSKGNVVYISGAAGDTTIVSKADASDPAKMAAFGLVLADITSGGSGQVVTFGNLYGSGGAPVDTSGYTLGDTLYVSTTPGVLANVPPTGEGTLVQNIGRVVRVAASNGVIKVGGAGRTNATPNLNSGNIFLGNGSNQAVSADFTYTANLAIADYSGNLDNLTGDVTTTAKISQAQTRTELIYSTGNVLTLGTETGTPVAFGTSVTIVPGNFRQPWNGVDVDSGTRLVVGDDTFAPYINSFGGHGPESLAVGGRLSVDSSMDLGGRYMYVGADQDDAFSTYNADTTPGNVRINFGLGAIDIVDAPDLVDGVEYRIVSAGTTNFTLVGAPNNNTNTRFTADLSGGAATGDGTVKGCEVGSIMASRTSRTGGLDYSMKMGWVDNIVSNAGENYDTGEFKAFSELADTKVDETFQANLTVSGNCFVTQATALSSSLNVTGITTLSGNTFIDGITTISANVDLNANLDVSRNVYVDASIRSRNTVLKQFNETKIDLGSQSGDLTSLSAFNAANGSIFTVTTTGGITLNSIPNATTGSSYKLIITNNTAGTNALTSTFKYKGGDKALSLVNGEIDILSIFYDGTNYYGTMDRDYN